MNNSQFVYQRLGFFGENIVNLSDQYIANGITCLAAIDKAYLTIAENELEKNNYVSYKTKRAELALSNPFYSWSVEKKSLPGKLLRLRETNFEEYKNIQGSLSLIFKNCLAQDANQISLLTAKKGQDPRKSAIEQIFRDYGLTFCPRGFFNTGIVAVISVDEDLYLAVSLVRPDTLYQEFGDCAVEFRVSFVMGSVIDPEIKIKTTSVSAFPIAIDQAVVGMNYVYRFDSTRELAVIVKIIAVSTIWLRDQLNNFSLSGKPTEILERW